MKVDIFPPLFYFPLPTTFAAMEAAWDLLECIPARMDSVDASLQDKADALEGHLYATEVLGGYGLAPPLTRYLEMGGGAEGFGRDLPRYTAFAKELVDQMCAVAMERAGLIDVGANPAVVSGGKLSVGRLFRRGVAKLPGAGGGGGRGGERVGGSGGGLNDAGREGIVNLHKDVSRLQANAWQVILSAVEYVDE